MTHEEKGRRHRGPKGREIGRQREDTKSKARSNGDKEVSTTRRHHKEPRAQETNHESEDWLTPNPHKVLLNKYPQFGVYPQLGIPHIARVQAALRYRLPSASTFRLSPRLRRTFAANAATRCTAAHVEVLAEAGASLEHPGRPHDPQLSGRIEGGGSGGCGCSAFAPARRCTTLSERGAGPGRDATTTLGRSCSIQIVFFQRIH